MKKDDLSAFGAWFGLIMGILMFMGVLIIAVSQYAHNVEEQKQKEQQRKEATYKILNPSENEGT